MSKDDRDRAKSYFVAVGQGGTPGDSLAAQEGPVLTSQVLESHLFAIDDDARVAARHAGYVEANISIK
jgi:hypothetical protein